MDALGLLFASTQDSSSVDLADAPAVVAEISLQARTGCLAMMIMPPPPILGRLEERPAPPTRNAKFSDETEEEFPVTGGTAGA
jgi:hypothetical protein